VPDIRFAPCSGGAFTRDGCIFSGRQPNFDCDGPLIFLNLVKLGIQSIQYKNYSKSSIHSFHAAFFWRCLSMMRQHYVRSYGAFGAQWRYRIKPMATPKLCSDVLAAVALWSIAFLSDRPTMGGTPSPSR
jgi:hypothetical protein